jgi:hypothetical protein
MLSHQISRQSVNEKGDVESTLSVVVEKANRMHEYVNDNETQIRVNRSDLVSRFYLVPLPYRSSWDSNIMLKHGNTFRNRSHLA